METWISVKLIEAEMHSFNQKCKLYNYLMGPNYLSAGSVQDAQANRRGRFELIKYPNYKIYIVAKTTCQSVPVWKYLDAVQETNFDL